MPRFKIYAERKISTVIEVDAETYEKALRYQVDHEPPLDRPEGCDWAGEWQAQTVHDGTEFVWERPRFGVIPVQERKLIAESMRRITETLRPIVEKFRQSAEALSNPTDIYTDTCPACSSRQRSVRGRVENPWAPQCSNAWHRGSERVTAAPEFPRDVIVAAWREFDDRRAASGCAESEAFARAVKVLADSLPRVAAAPKPGR